MIVASESVKHLPCSCCQRPYAELIELPSGEIGLLVLARHEAGVKHANILTVEKLQQMIDEFKNRH